MESTDFFIRTMANSQQILEIKLDARNRLLKSERRGVTIYIRKDGFTLRAYLPSKSNPDGPSLYCAVIVKKVDEKTRSKTSINDLLRD